VRIVGDAPPGPVDSSLLTDDAERALVAALDAFDGSPESAAALAPVVARFFEEVLVMAEDESVRRNRLTLVAEVADRLRRSVGDLDMLPG
jgi:glycyl-tRNA synthetase beta chain